MENQGKRKRGRDREIHGGKRDKESVMETWHPAGI